MPSKRVFSHEQDDMLRNVRCRAAVLLMGCSSGRLRDAGEYDPSGMALTYLLAGAPGTMLLLCFFPYLTLEPCIVGTDLL